MNIKDSKPKRKSSKKSSTNTLPIILGYAKRGWAVFPIYPVDANGKCTCDRESCPERDQGKHPLTNNGFHDASKVPAQIRKWYAAHPGCNWAVATGAISNLTVVDVDMGIGKVGDVTWAALIETHGEPPTLMAKTGGGGVHCWFAYSEDPKGRNDALGTHVDVKNDKGYVLVHPSNHRLGGAYEWLNWGTELAPVPEWMKEKRETRGRPRNDDWARRHTYTLEEVKGMLKVISADNRTLWLNVGVILGRTFERSDDAWTIYNEWADKYEGERKADHAKTMHTAFYTTSQIKKDKELTMGTIVHEAMKAGWAPVRGAVPIEDLLYGVEANEYLDRRSGKYWVAAAVDAVVSPVNVEGKILKASEWLKRHRSVTSLARDPTVKGDYLVGVDCLDGEIVSREGRACFNQYRHATIALGDPDQAGPFVDHVRLLFNKEGDADQFLDYLAHLVQRPGVKPRFALLIAGPQGNGKDTALSFCYPAIGHWNVYPIDPKVLEGGFNEHEAATLVVISEAANPQEMSKWAFNEKTKVLIAGNPDHTTVNPKYGVKYSCRRFCGVALTTNNLASGIYIPQDDRRYDVLDTATFAEMKLEEEATRRSYFERLYRWFYAGGDRHVAAFLHARDLAGFSPDHGQRKTAAHQSVVAANLESDAWLLDILSELGDPKVVRADWIETKAVGVGEPHEYKPMEVRRKLRPAMERAGYLKYGNPKKKDGRWYLERNKGVVVYIKIGTPAPTAEELKTLVLTKTKF